MDTPTFDVLDTSHDLREENLETSLMGRYKLGSKLGGGGSGVVFKARQSLPVQREVVIKVLRGQVNTTPIIARFEMERQALAMMDHPGIARVLDAGETVDGRLFFAMERADGTSITSYVRQTSPVLRDRLRLFIAVCEAVHHAHQKGVIHRDLKPANILVTVENGIPKPKVVDFGLARALEARALGKHVIFTLHDQIIGTPGYISPEQAEHGGAAADVRGDVYALGALLYEMLTGTAAVDQKSLIGKPMEVALRAAIEQPLVPPSARDRNLRGDLDAIVLKALAIDPNQRYASAEALASDVQRHLNDWPVSARARGMLYLLGKWMRRYRWAVAAGTVALAAAAPKGWHFLQQYRQQQQEHALEVQQRSARLHNSSRKYFHDARLLSERGRNSDAIAHLAFALREDPQNGTAATYLSALLMQSHLGHRSSMTLSVKPGWEHIMHVAVNAQHRVAVAVCSGDKEKPDLIMRWSLDVSQGTENAATELGLPAGLKISAVQTSSDDGFLILGFTDGSLARYDIGAAAFLQFEDKLTESVAALAISGHGEFVMAAANPKAGGAETRLWDIAQGKPAAAVRPLIEPVQKMVIDEKAKNVVVAHGRALSLLDPRGTGDIHAPRGVSDGFISTLSVNPQGTLVAVGLWNGLIQVYETSNHLLPLGAPLVSTAPITDTGFNADGEVLLTGDSNGVVMTWNAREMRPLDAGEKLNGGIRLCRMTGGPQPMTLAISERGDLRLWQQDGQTVSAHQSQQLVDLCAASHDGSLTIDVQAREAALEVWELHASMLQPRVWKDPVPEAAGALTASAGQAGESELMLKSAQRTFTCDPDHQVHVTETVSGRQVCENLRHDAPVQHLALTPDGRSLITITTEGAHRVWDTLTGDPLTPTLKRNERATAVQPLAGGSGYLYRRENGTWMQLPLPARIPEAPAWFIDFAEARCSKRLHADGTATSIPREKQADIVKALPESEMSPLARLARWLRKRPAERSEWPQ
ncbi:WD40 repeat domain-containing serine/threonine protein kinase [Brevifollis gellanilyticus]|nr:WD40 repeat domain-containing serine/threonine protein kinase [Brevifollis gellanilyticus]